MNGQVAVLALQSGGGTALGIAAPDTHFRNRVNQLGGVINSAGRYILNRLRGFILPAAARDVALDASVGIVRFASGGASIALYICTRSVSVSIRPSVQ